MADLLTDWIPLFQEDASTIRARIDADVNAGLAPDDPNFNDTTEGGIYFDLSQTMVLEIERVWDALANEYPASMFPAFAFGDYLDEHGITWSVARHDAVAATGTVTFTGTAGALIATGTRVATPQTDPDTAPPEFATLADAVIPIGGTVDVAVQAVTPGVAGNVGAGTITSITSPVQNVTAVTNAAAISGGAEVEDDDTFRERILLRISSSPGQGNQAAYRQWALDYAGVGHVTVQPLWAGAGTVRLIITDPDNNPSSTTVINGLQAELDPVAGAGAGLAPIGAVVTVATVSLHVVAISATVVHASGYSLDGTSGTIPTRAAILAAIADYINGLNPDDDVYLRHVEARFFAVPGVLDVTGLLLNGSAANVTIGGLEVAELGTVTLS